MANTLKTTLLLGALTGLLLLLGQAIGGNNGMVVAFLFAGVMNFGAWWFSDSIVLRTSGAVPVEDPRLAWLEEDLADLAKRAGIPKPRLYLVPHEPSPNAFATGRSPDRGVVAVTAGLLNTLDRRAIRGVLAHEIGHIAHRDTLVSAVAATVAGAITMVARMLAWGAMLGGGRNDQEGEGGGGLGGLLLVILAPIAATIIHMAVSRTREYAADARAARITGDPEGLAQALEGLAYGGRRIPMQDGNPSTHYIVNNFAGGLANLFSTHPPIEERIRRLREMARGR